MTESADMRGHFCPNLARYAAAVACVAVATGLRRLLDPVLSEHYPYTTLFFAILLTAWHGGFGPATAATALGAVAARVFLVHGGGTAQQVELSIYAVIGLGIAALGGAMRAARQRAEAEASRLAVQGEELRTTLASLVADRRRAEEADRRLAAIVASSDDVIIGKALDGTIISWNAGAERVYGYSAAEAIGMPVSILVPPDRTDEQQDIAGRLARGERLEHHETVRRRKDGTLIDVSVSYSPIRDNEGHVVGTAVIARDITERILARNAARERRRQLELVTDNAPVLLAHCDVQRRFKFVNKAYAERFGLTPPDVVGKHFSDILGPEAYAVIAPYVDTVLAGKRVEFEVEVPYRNIGRQFMRCAYQPELDAAGRVVGYVAALINVTQSKRSEEALREEARTTDTLHRIGTALAADLDLKRVVQTVTDEATALTGAKFGAFFHKVRNERGESYQLYTISGMTLEAFAGFPMPRITAILEPTFRGLGVIRLDDVTRDPRYGKNLPYHGMPAGHLPVRSHLAVPVVLRDGEVLGGLFFGDPEAGVFTARHERLVVGIAAQAAVAIENARLYQAVRDADRRKEEFLSVLAHELRNPLAPVRNGLHILHLAGGDPQVAGPALEMMERQVQHLVRLVDDLLDVSRILRNRVELRREPIDLASVASRAVETARPILDAEEHTLTVEPPSEPLWVDGDPVRLAQVVGNLLSNAARYTPRGGKVWIRTAREGDRAVLRVRDTGVGIASEALPNIWQMFYQADRSTKNAQGGMGIGLTLVRSLTELHGGTVEVHSEGPGHGSEFVLSLPLLPGGDPHGAPSWARVSTGLARRVLIVDDNKDAAESLALLLRLRGHEVRVAHDGPSALCLAAADPPEVVFLDLGMPIMDGYEVATRLRADPALRGVMLVALTGWGQDQDRQRTRETGFDHHLVKPVEPDDVAALLAAP